MSRPSLTTLGAVHRAFLGTFLAFSMGSRPGLSAPAPTPDPAIDYLLSQVETSTATFIRNGARHTGRCFDVWLSACLAVYRQGHPPSTDSE